MLHCHENQSKLLGYQRVGVRNNLLHSVFEIFVVCKLTIIRSSEDVIVYRAGLPNSISFPRMSKLKK